MFSIKQVGAVLTGLALVGSTTAAGTTHTIEVGNGAFVFSPNRTVAAVGDVLEFVYYPANHSVVQSEFQSPCRSTSGFFSGFQRVQAGQRGNTTFRVTVNDTNPIWFYCSQPGGGGHCRLGMVGCANCPETGERTLAAFAAGAAQTTNMTVTQPAAINGGVFAALDASSTNSTPPSGTGSGATPSTSTPGNAADALGAASSWKLLSVGAGLAGLALFL